MHQPAGTSALARRCVLMAIALLAFLLSACQVRPTASASPVAGGGLIAQPSQIDLGRVPFNQPADARFTIVNAGATEVHLNPDVDVQALEGC